MLVEQGLTVGAARQGTLAGNQRDIDTALTAAFDYRSAATPYRLARTPPDRSRVLLKTRAGKLKVEAARRNGTASART